MTAELFSKEVFQPSVIKEELTPPSEKAVLAFNSDRCFMCSLICNLATSARPKHKTTYK